MAVFWNSIHSYTENVTHGMWVGRYLKWRGGGRHLQTLSDDIREALKEDITVQEVEQAKKPLNTGKTLGFDGIPPEFYKAFEELLVTPYLKCTKRQ